jgi:hypothetical protein
VGTLVNREALRPLESESVSLGDRPGGARVPVQVAGRVCGRTFRSCSGYLSYGLRLLGQAFTAGAWCAEHREAEGRNDAPVNGSWSTPE